MADRPKVGPADAETRRKKLREVLDGERDRPVKKPTMKDAVDKGVDLGTEKPKKRKLERRFGPKGKSMNEIETE